MREITGLVTADLLRIFQQIDFFDPFTDEERFVLAESSLHVLAYDVGEYLIQEGSVEERSLFLLLSGGASVVKQGAAIPLATLHPGEFFGEVAFFTTRPRTSNVIVHPTDANPRDFPTVSISASPEISDLQQSFAATVLRFDPPLMPLLDPWLRIRIKDQIILHLTRRVDRMHAEVVRATHRDPMLSVDADLELRLCDLDLSLDAREQIKDQLIEQLAAFLDELNQMLVA